MHTIKALLIVLNFIKSIREWKKGTSHFLIFKGSSYKLMTFLHERRIIFFK